MLESSKDLLYIVLAFSALWITLFLCWVMYSMAMILRRANDIIHELRERLRGISESVDFLRDRVDGLGKAVDYLLDVTKKQKSIK